MSLIHGIEVTDKEYHQYYLGKKDIVKTAHCHFCRGKNGRKARQRKCTLTMVGSGTLSNPRNDIWLCKSHIGKAW